MDELALNILDITKNSVKAGAKNISVAVEIDPAADVLRIEIADDGCGMTPEFLAKVTDPFTTTRTTRKVGMGIPLFKMTAEITGGSFEIDSEAGKGTRVAATFVLSSIDRPPLGDVGFTAATLISGSPNVRFVFKYAYGNRVYVFDTDELTGFDVTDAFVVKYVGDMIGENIENINGGQYI